MGETPCLNAASLFEKLFEFSPDAVVVVDQTGSIVRANAQAEAMFGYEREEIIGQSVEMLMPEQFRAAHPKHRTNYNATPHRRPMGAGLELFGRRKDGSEFPVDIMLSPLETADGPVVLSAIRDISEKRRVEEVLRQSEHQLRLIVESVKDYAIFLLDLQGRVLTWNPGAERIKQYTAEEILGRHFSCFFTDEDIERRKPEGELRAAAAEGRFEDDGWRIRKDGSRFWAHAILTAIHDQNGNVTGFVKVTCDLTDRKKAEDSLFLEFSNALLSNLDISTLLSAISNGVRNVVAHDLATLALYDPEVNKLRIQQLDASHIDELIPGELLVPVDDSVTGFVFTTREPLLLSSVDAGRFSSEATRQFIAAGFKSACCVPLLGRDKVLGTLGVASKREAAFKHKDLRMLTQLASHVAMAVDNALAYRQITELRDRLAREKRYLEEELRIANSFEDIIGETPALKKVLKHVETVAVTDATVLILGETGTGKELIARAIHELSPRHDRAFVKLNCSAIPAGLLESELFGHEKGAFTGAIAQRIGRLELAHQGTLFLDEIGDLPLELQPKILRALQEREFERLGGTRTIPVNVRLVAATNRDLGKMVEQREFRSDLYYRLKVYPIEIPPLRQRAEDIPLLVKYFVNQHARRMNRHIETIPPEMMQAVTRWRWPGNVRELENFIERAVILSPGPVLRAPLAELQLTAEPASEPNANLQDAERQHILRVLREAKGMISGPTGAAKQLGLKRTTLNSKLKKLGIKRSDYI